MKFFNVVAVSTVLTAFVLVDGGSTAYIHLSGCSWGHNYPVTKVGKTKVKGKTKDGTPFTCVKQ